MGKTLVLGWPSARTAGSVYLKLHLIFGEKKKQFTFHHRIVNRKFG